MSVDNLDPRTIASFKKLIQDGEADFMTTLGEARANEHARALVALGVTDLDGLTRRLATALQMPIYVPGGVQERFHLYFSLLALHPARAILAEYLKKQGKEPRFDSNSHHDTSVAQHLAEGVFVVTDDRRFIVSDVDVTNSFQAPWVRTPWELLEVDLPEGPPWGRGAKRAREKHARRTIPALKDIEASAREHLPGRPT
jgi:uncharacterized membrane protein